MSKTIKKPEIKMIPINLLMEDPLNREAFNEGELDQLVSAIREKGFFGDVAAFPCEDGKYMLESGHRRRKAAIKAGLTEIPVFVTDPPKNEIERRIRLTQWNMNGRDFTPMDVAKLVKFTYDTLALKKEAGEITGSLLDLTAKELNISSSSVTKYKSLLLLPRSLQKIAASGSCSWAVVASASALPPEGQQALAMRVSGMQKLGMLNTENLKREIDEFKHVKMFKTVSESKYEKYIQPDHEIISLKESNTTDQKITPLKKKNEKRFRRCDGMKGIIKSWELLKNSLSENAFIKGKDEERVIAYLKDIVDIAENALHDFEH